MLGLIESQFWEIVLLTVGTICVLWFVKKVAGLEMLRTLEPGS